MNKHTPGPWCCINGAVYRDRDDAATPIAFMCRDEQATRGGTWPVEQDCNAVLIASAPTMLAALEGCVAYLEHLRTFCPDQGRDARFEAACAAIALATGKEK